MLLSQSMASNKILFLVCFLISEIQCNVDDDGDDDDDFDDDDGSRWFGFMNKDSMALSCRSSFQLVP